MQDEAEPRRATFNLEDVCEEEPPTADDVFVEADGHPPNIPSSFSTDELLTGGGYARPISSLFGRVLCEHAGV